MDRQEEHDYVIVGAGSAGCVLARRLIERTGARVLLLEAGGPDDRAVVHRTDIPSMVSMWDQEDYTWPYLTTPQPGLDGRRIALPQGRLLGGGSSVNAMMYVRGNRRDFDGWQARGNPGWGYRDVLPYFTRAETFAEAGAGGDGYRGADGPLSVVGYEDPSPVARAFVAAAVETGLAADEGDYNAGRQEDTAFYYQSTRTKDDQRCSTAVAYLAPVLADPRLTVRTDARVQQVLLQGGRAVGVSYLHQGVVRQALAGSEVVLAAGALATPRLLLLSGIGPAEELRGHGIETLVDLPGVGRNLQDHLLVGIAFESLVDLPFPQLLAEAGLVTATGRDSGADDPDLQYFFGPVQFVDDRFKTDGPGFTFAPIVVQPRSRGSVTLASARPEDLPVVDPHYLEHPADLEVLVRGLELARELAGRPAFAPFRGRELAPGVEAGRSELEAYVRAYASTVWHPVGTCRMGVHEDCVVDPALRVRGVDGLRVVDASIMPTITRGNTNATAIMIGEKAADLVAPAVPH
ncbi:MULTISPECIES: GMC family oxidoreductase [Streptacidiphilus]|uniref:GMC family oxidoreductase n=1 Tax=Streptacidiphilus cavernicola TaxID=3342716 RepID=A0ABV6UK17_9ACTN|nr:GMC family oxidoreductase N-terminal domain-containing protein [Streptacidiphilus jeojiense]